MKGTVALIIIFCFCVCRNAQAQTVTLAGKNLDIEKVFREIRKQTGYNFIYNVAWLHQMKPVTLTLDHVALTDALNKTFSDEPFTYTIIDKTIALKEKPVAQKKNDNLNTPEEILGQVTDSLGNALAGASVIIKGSRSGTTTDANGFFKLSGTYENAVLVISYTGYNSKQILVKEGHSVNIQLYKSVSPLDEIQVIAYGSVTKALNTGDVTTIKAKQIEMQPVSNPLLALGGSVPGMQISQSNGLPGASVIVQIRGQNSIASGNYPFYVVDGVPYQSANYLPQLNMVLGNSNTTEGAPANPGSPFDYLNPGDIESIEILKDADATAIYGSRGANGVVLITTKKGKIGQTRVDFNIQNGWGQVADKMKLLNTPQYLEMRNEAFKNDGTAPDPNADYDLTLWDTTRNTDWQKNLIGGTSSYTDVQGSVSGGNTGTQFLIGGAYHKESTVFMGDFYDQKASVHFNINNTSPNQKFRITLSGLYLVDDNHLSGVDPTLQALQLAPDAPPLYNPDGTINWALNSAGNSTWPISNPATMNLLNYKINTSNLISNAVLSYRIIEGFTIKSSFGYTNTQSDQSQTLPLIYYQPSARPTSQRKAGFDNNNTHSWIIEPQVTYSKNFSAGILNIVIGSTIQQNYSKGESLGATGFSSDLVLEDIGAATTVVAAYTVDEYKYNAVFGRVNYNLKDKYIINLTARRDGSSRFGPANQFHNFGAVGLGWIFSKEKFLQNNFSFVSFGKLRGSYGTTGNDQVGDYTFMDLYSPIGSGTPYQGALGYTPTRIYTPDLSWEETKKLEGGIELGFLKDRILVSASYYRNRSSNQLVGYLLPTIAGFTTVEKNLPAVVQNQGWEFELKTVNVATKFFKWTTSFNLSLNRNVLLSGAAGLDAFYQSKIGYPLTSRLVYNYLGVDPFTGIYQVGNSQGKPVVNPGPVDASYRVDFQQKFYGGLQNSVVYNGFELDFLLQFVDQPENYNYFLGSGIPGSFNGSFGGNQPQYILNRWQQPGDVQPIQRFSQNLSTYPSWNNAQGSNQILSNSSFIRVKNISLSWQLPERWQEPMHLKSARIYVHAQNLFTITSYYGLDPETNSGSLPPLKVLTVGIQISL